MSKQVPSQAHQTVTVLGLFEAIDPAARALNKLRNDLNHDPADLMVMTSVPLPEGVLQADDTKSKLPIITVVAAFVGIGVGLLLAGGSAALYVLRTGGKPILSGPPIGIIAYEIMMLVALTTAFLAALYEMRLPNWRSRVYDPRISEGMIGIAVRCHSDSAQSVKDAFDASGAADLLIDRREFD